MTLTFNLPEQMFQMRLLLLKTNCAKLFWSPSINVELMAQTSSISDHFMFDTSSATLTLNLFEQMLLLNENKCQIILKSMHKCRSSIYDHFIIWPSSLTLIFNLPEQMFQMALLLLKENNCAKLFWNPCINVQVMAQFKLNFWPFHVWHFKCDLDLKPIWKNVSNSSVTPKWEQLCQISLKSMHKYRSSIYDHFIIWPSSVTLIFNLPEQMFQMALLLLKENNCAKLFWNPCINVQVMAQSKLNFWPFYVWHLKCDLDLKPIWTNVSNSSVTPKGEQLCQIILKSMRKWRSSSYNHFIIWPSRVTLTFNLPEQMFQEKILCLIILKSMHTCASYGPVKFGRMQACMHNARTYTEFKL